jgi:hypothetical protein
MKDGVVNEIPELLLQPPFLGEHHVSFDPTLGSTLGRQELEELLAEVPDDERRIRLVAPESRGPTLRHAQRPVGWDVEEARRIRSRPSRRDIDRSPGESHGGRVRPGPLHPFSEVDRAELRPAGPAEPPLPKGAGNATSVDGKLEQLQSEALAGGLGAHQHGQVAEGDVDPPELGEVLDVKSRARHGQTVTQASLPEDRAHRKPS